MITATDGTLHLRLADSDAVFSCGEGVRVSYHRTVTEPCDDAPYGIETVTVTSPARWLHYSEVDGVHALSMGEPPTYETIAPTSEQSFDVTSALMGGVV
jgi:hypothetical protein